MSFSNKNLVRSLSVLEEFDNDTEIYLLSENGKKVPIKGSRFIDFLSTDIIEKNFGLNALNEEHLLDESKTYVTIQALAIIIGSLITHDQFSQAIDNLVTKTDLTTALSEFAVDPNTNAPTGSYISQNDLNSAIEFLVTELRLETILADYIKGNDLTTTLDLFVKKEDMAETIENFISVADFQTQTNSFVRQDDLALSLGGLVTQTSFETAIVSFVTEEQLSLTVSSLVNENFVTAAIGSLATKQEVTNTVNLLASKIDLTAAVSSLATKTELENAIASVSDSLVTQTNGREILVSSKAFYVRKDGNDTNTGLTNTAGGALLTIQAAINKAVAYDFNNSVFEITITVGAGTYNENLIFPPLFNSGYLNATTADAKITLLGKVGTYTTASDVVIKPTLNKAGLNCFGNTATYHLNGFTLDCSLLPQPNNCLLVENGGSLDLTSFSLILSTGNSGIVASGKNTIIYCNSSNFRLEGNGVNYLGCYDGAEIVYSPSALTVINNPSITIVAIVRNSAILKYYAPTAIGTIVGKRYDISVLGTINTNTGSKTLIPGTTSGSLPANAGSNYY